MIFIYFYFLIPFKKRTKKKDIEKSNTKEVAHFIFYSFDKLYDHFNLLNKLIL